MARYFFMILAICLVLQNCECSRKIFVNVTINDQSNNWDSAGATWYGPPQGAGSDGGACGYVGAVEQPPFNKMISAGGPSIFQSGLGCGVCYEVKCMNNQACSGNPVTVTITDNCPECTNDAFHFDLSGTTFGALAKPGQDNQLRTAGVLQLQFQKVKCNYPGVMVAVRVDQGSNPYYFAAAIEYEGGLGLQNVELKPKTSGWTSMRESWGAVWAINSGSQLQAPFSIKLTEKDSGRTLVLDDVIPVGWNPGQTYRSHTNFN